MFKKKLLYVLFVILLSLVFVSSIVILWILIRKSEKWYNTLTIIIGIFGFPLLILQLWLFKRDVNSRFDYQKREKAVEMAKIFMEFLPEITKIEFLLKSTSLPEYLKNIEYHTFLHFNYNEFSSHFEDAVILSEITQIFTNPRLVIKDDNFEGILYDVLNKLEWFSMHFTNDIADEEVVYQSLHQVYLRIVILLYPKISIMNKDGAKDKYYCNIIRLYANWAEIYKLSKEKEAKQIETQLEQERKSLRIKSKIKI